MEGLLTLSWITLLLVSSRTIVTALDLDACEQILGMETGEIPDSALSASSQMGGRDSKLSAQNSRIRDPGAWCPANTIDADTYEYLQVDFREMKVLTVIETQGRFGGGKGQEFVEQYKLQYQRENNGAWFTFKNRRGNQILYGNTNAYGSEIRNIDPPIITRRLRIVPYSEIPKEVCLRVEFYGCTWHDHVVAYTMPDGETRKNEIHLVDQTYDGDRMNGKLTGGMGQLTDGITGLSNYRTIDDSMSIKGYNWIGWKNESFMGQPVELIFKFDSVRNFTTMRIHMNNFLSRDVRVFRRAIVYTSVGGDYYTSEPIVFSYMRDTIMEYARNVIISLNHKTGQYVKLQLYFDSKWMMLSEVEFESLSVSAAIPVEQRPDGDSTDPFVVDNPKPTQTTHRHYVVKVPTGETPIDTDGDKQGIPHKPTGSEVIGAGDSQEDKENEDNDRGVVLIPDNNDGPGVDTDTKTGTPPPTTVKNTVLSAPHNTGGIREEHIGVIVGTLIALIIIVAVIVFFILMRNRKNRKYRNRTCLQAQNSTFEDLRSGTLKSSKSSNGNLYNFVATSDIDSSERGLTTCCTNNANTSSVYGDISDGSVHTRKYPEFPRTPDSTFSNGRDYAVPDIMQSAVVVPGNGVNSSFVYSPSGVGTISGTVLGSAAAPWTTNLGPQGAYTNTVVGGGGGGGSFTGGGNNTAKVLGPNVNGGGNSNIPPRLPVPPPPPTPYPGVAVPYASSDLVTLQAPKAFLHNNSSSRAATPVNNGNSNNPNASRNSPPTDFLHQGATLQQGVPLSVSAANTNPFTSTTNTTATTNPLLHSLSRNSIQGVAGTNTFSVASTDSSDEQWAEELSVMEFPRGSLRYLDKLGEGQFGEVHLCLAQNLDDLLGGDFLLNRTGSQDMLVAVKMLKPHADQHARENFKQEAKIQSRLKDTNVVQVLGVCSRQDPLCVIVEYMKHGDLHQFLQKHTLEGVEENLPALSYGCLIYMVSQMASGMKYLETQNLVHRDLAARNCLLGNNYTIKISDFGMSRGLYSCDYYKIEGRAMLPIRWMAWESVILGKFSSKSDVWSFAVTLWEVLNFAREQPFNDLNDELVIQNCTHFYHGDGQQVYLPVPRHCPKEIYDLMCECWNPDESQRPSFREIHMFLQGKNMGFDPSIEYPDPLSEEPQLEETDYRVV